MAGRIERKAQSKEIRHHSRRRRSLFALQIREYNEKQPNQPFSEKRWFCR
jgi:hypothetical protein